VNGLLTLQWDTTGIPQNALYTLHLGFIVEAGYAVGGSITVSCSIGGYTFEQTFTSGLGNGLDFIVPMRILNGLTNENMDVSITAVGVPENGTGTAGTISFNSASIKFYLPD
jgi:hypothetical protein